MELKIVKIDGDFVVVELENGERRICPIDIFPENIAYGDVAYIVISNEEQNASPNDHIV